MFSKYLAAVNSRRGFDVQPPTAGFALVATNCILDQYGRIGARKGWSRVNPSSGNLGANDVGVIHELVQNDGTLTVLFAGNNKFQYAVTDPSLIIVPPDREIELPNPEVNCLISEEALNRVMKALSVSQLPEIAIVGKNGKILLQAVDTRGTSNDSFSVEVGETEARFRMVFRSDCMKLIPGSYDVSISSKGLSHWKGATVEYWIAVESNSSFEA